MSVKSEFDQLQQALRSGRHVLVTIVAALCASACAANLSSPRHVLPDPLEAGWRGQPVCENLHEDSDSRVLRCTFPPSVGHERHYHTRHFGYALSGGRMRLTDASGTRDVDLPSNSSFASDGTEWHEVLNIGNTTVVYLIVESK